MNFEELLGQHFFKNHNETRRLRLKQRSFHLNFIPKVWLHKKLTKKVMPTKFSSPNLYLNLGEMT